jgi:hypothetical protein
MNRRLGQRMTARLVVPLCAAVMMVASSTVSAGAAPVVGTDISWPQCGRSYPAPSAFSILGVNDGRPYTANPCLAAEYRWARSSGVVEFYMNTANPGVAMGDAYNYGFGAARYAFTYATAHLGAGAGHLWWLDVETGNTWSPDQGANTAVITGSVAFFRAHGVRVGIYSTKYQWGLLTGGASIASVPNWVPGARSAREAPSFCAAGRSFSGGPVVMAQYTTVFDYDYLCPGVSLPALTAGPPPGLPPPDVGISNLVNGILAWLNAR